MKSLFSAAFVAALAIPGAAFAQAVQPQSNQPVTRAEVKSDLKRVEQAGYNPATSNDDNYPANVQAAEARAAGRTGGGYGGLQSGSSASDSPQHGAAQSNGQK